MKTLGTLSEYSQGKLDEYGFKQTVGESMGMHQSYEWANDTLKICLYYDRGYFDCLIAATQKRTPIQLLIPLLRFIKNDPKYQEQELKDAKRWNTLEPNVYLGLIFEHVAEILNFFESVDAEVLEKKKKFEITAHASKETD